MIQNLAITILVDDQSNNPELLREHGLSIWIEADDQRILFDTGQSDIIINNASALGINLASADALVLSHGHYDHTGGVGPVVQSNPGIHIYCHPAIFIPRYKRQSDGSMKSIGINKTAICALHDKIDTISWVIKPAMIATGIGITGPIPRVNAHEDVGGPNFLDTQGMYPDPIDDDLSLWIETVQGTVLVTGCCHSGIVNTLEFVAKNSSCKRMLSIVGGFHLLHASLERIQWSCQSIQSFLPQRVVALHCSGEATIDYFGKKLETVFLHGETGLRIEFKDRF